MSTSDPAFELSPVAARKIGFGKFGSAKSSKCFRRRAEDFVHAAQHHFAGMNHGGVDALKRVNGAIALALHWAFHAAKRRP